MEELETIDCHMDTIADFEKSQQESTPPDVELFERRRYIVREIMTTEEAYCMGLEVMALDYQVKLLEAADTANLPGISKEDIRNIFLNVEHLHSISKHFLADISLRVIDWQEDSLIGDIFILWTPLFLNYASYQNCFKKAGELLTKCQTNDAFNEMVSSIENQVRSKGVVALENLLIKPIQRIPRYVLLVEELYRKTPISHPDKDNLQEAIKKLQKLTTFLDQEITSYENRELFLSLAQQIHGAKDLVKAHRTILATGVLSLKPEPNTRVVKSKLTKDRKLEIWLCNDVLVHLKSSKSKKKTNVASTKHTWPLQLVWLEDLEPDLTDPKMPFVFNLIGPQKTFTLRFSDVNEKNHWLEQITTAVEKQLSYDTAPSYANRYGAYKFPDKHSSEYIGWWMNGHLHGHGTYTIFGNTYTGEWQFDRKCGFGTFTSITGVIYSGEWENDHAHGYGRLEHPDGLHYDGLWENGMRHGKGRLNYANGDFYSGEWANDVPSGTGTYSTTTGINYCGSWKNGKSHGYGCLVTPNGRRYEGEFRNGQKSGEGKLDFHNGDFYIGQWQMDRFHGYGILHCGVEGVYEGMFVAGFKEGYGKMRYRNGCAFEGYWRRGLYKGQGTLVCPTGGFKRYVGQWDDGKMNGKGIIYYRDGSKYEGQFKDDQPHGIGAYMSANNVSYDGRWVNGRREGKATITVGPTSFPSNCDNNMLGKREASFMVVPDVPFIRLEL